MNQDEFDTELLSRPFTLADAVHHHVQAGRCASLAVALWGWRDEDLQRQLSAPHPEVPAGFTLTDYRKLLHTARTLAVCADDARFAWVPRSAISSRTILVGGQRLTAAEARCEVVRRAIHYLETSG